MLFLWWRLPGCPKPPIPISSYLKRSLRPTLSGQAENTPIRSTSTFPNFAVSFPICGLTYNSSDISRAGAENFVGFGWRLSGLSRIERESVGGGAPAFHNGQDIFRLDGAELMACDDADATNKWTSKYPLRYLTTVKSASCAAGGNFSTRVESYNKITYHTSAKEWTVVRQDGRRYRYQAVGVLAGDTSTSGDSFRVGHKSRWVLTEITDTQKDASGNYTNKVTIAWQMRTAGNGFAERPIEISYSGYRVVLEYEQLSQPMSYFGTGTGYLGRQHQRLSDIVVYDGTTPVRGYKLVRQLSALTDTILLKTGRDLWLRSGRKRWRHLGWHEAAGCEFRLFRRHFLHGPEELFRGRIPQPHDRHRLGPFRARSSDPAWRRPAVHEGRWRQWR